MAVMKEWRCMAHGDFDSTEQACPRGCGAGMVERVFRTPPSIQSQGYRNINASLQDTAAQFGLRNMDNFSGEGQRKSDWQTHKRLEEGTNQVFQGQRDAIGQFMEGKAKAMRSTFGTVARPIGEVISPTGDTRGFGGSLFRAQNGGMAVQGVSDAMALPRPTPQLAAPAYDGRAAGLPSAEK